MTSPSKPLKDEIKRRFYPFVASRGFLRQKSENPFFTAFVRECGDRTDRFDIQWDHYWRPYFVLNFGSLEDATPIGRLQRSRGGDLWHWFSLRRPWLEKLASGKWNYTPDEVTNELLNAFEQLETFWATGVAGSHIHLDR